MKIRNFSKTLNALLDPGQRQLLARCVRKAARVKKKTGPRRLKEPRGQVQQERAA
jgi:hypothetical protein